MFFFFNDTATTEIYTLSLHDALPISTFRLMKLEQRIEELRRELAIAEREQDYEKVSRLSAEQIQLSSLRQGMLQPQTERSEEHTSELQSRQYLVCRLLLEKKKKKKSL